MRKYRWIIVLALIGCTIAFAGCQRIPKVVTPGTSDPEAPAETVEPPAEMVEMPTEEVMPEMEPAEPIEAMEVPETVPETPEEPMVVEPTVPVIEDPIVSDSPHISLPAVGGQLFMRINIAQAADITGYQLTLLFDETALRYVNISNADYLPGEVYPVVQTSENSVHILATSFGGAVASESSGTLATVTFEVVAAKASVLKLSEVILSNNAGESIYESSGALLFLNDIPFNNEGEVTLK